MSQTEDDDLFAELFDDIDNPGDTSDEELLDPETSQGLAHQYAPIEGGSFLILSGPGAGKVVPRPPGGSGTSPVHPVMSRDEALDGGRPILMIHRAYAGAGSLPRLHANLHAISGGHFAVGSILPIPSISDKGRREWAPALPTASLRIADPRAFILDPDEIRLPKKPVSDRAKLYAPYLAAASATDWVKQVLDAQRSIDANLLLTSGRALPVGAPQKSLDAAFGEGDDALAELETDERLALNLTLNSRWLTDGALREKLFAELVDREQFEAWYIRVQWRGVSGQGQPTSAKLMTGYRALAELAQDEEKLLLLPQTGLTGWYLTALGARGFGAGVAGGHNAFLEPGGGGGNQPKIERYFERQLLHTVERTAHDALASLNDYLPCNCIYCPSLLTRGRAWNHELAGLHQVTGFGALLAQAGIEANRGGIRASARRAVTAASKYESGKPLTGPNAPTHLSVWGQAL